MTILRHDETDRFRVRGEDGKEYEVVERTAILDDSTVSGPTDTVAGMREYQTTDGRTVNRLGGRFEILEMDSEPTIVATRID